MGTFQLSKNLLLTLILVAMSTQSTAQDAEEDAVQSEELKKLKDQESILESQKNISEYQKEILANQVAMDKAFELAAPDGSASIDSQQIETILISNKTLKSAVSKLVTNMLNDLPKDALKPNTMVYYDKNNIDRIFQYKALLSELNNLSSTFGRDKAEANKVVQLSLEHQPAEADLPILTAATSIFGVLQAIAVVGSAFKTESTYKISDVTFDEKDFVAALAKELNKKSINVYAPTLYPILTNFSNSLLLLKLQEIATQTNESQAILGELNNRVAVIKKSLVKPEDDSHKKFFQNLLSVHEKAIVKLETNSNNEKAVLTRLYTDKENKTLLGSILATESLAQTLEDTGTYTIMLKASAKGGTVSKKGWFINNHLEHSGGVVLTCLIFDKNGMVKFSDVIREYLPYKKEVLDRI